MFNYSKTFKKFICAFTTATFLSFSIGPFPEAKAESLPGLMQPGTLIFPTVSTSISTALTEPPLLKGIELKTQDPFNLTFLIAPGQASGLSNQAIKEDINELIRFFLAALTIPEKDLWVNLSPYEKDRIIPQEFGLTDMGQELLAQDYVLKQLMASLTYPESQKGQAFWQKVYAKAFQTHGTTNLPINTFNKVWIVPDKAVIYEKDNKAFIIKSQLKVMLEGDYLAMTKAREQKQSDTDKLSAQDVKEISDISSEVMKEDFLKVVENEVNQGIHFARLRQVYSALVLASWFKKNLKENILNQMYTGQKKIEGIKGPDQDTVQKVYEQYVEAFKKGAYQMIIEEYDPIAQTQIARQYFSGGADFTEVEIIDKAQLTVEESRAVDIPIIAADIELKPIAPTHTPEQKAEILATTKASLNDQLTQNLIAQQKADDELNDLYKEDTINPKAIESTTERLENLQVQEQLIRQQIKQIEKEIETLVKAFPGVGEIFTVYFIGNHDTLEKQAARELLQKAYSSKQPRIELLGKKERQTLQPGFGLKEGMFRTGFLLPAGNSIGSNRYLKFGNLQGLTSVGVIIHKKKNGKVEYIEFHGFAGDKKIGESVFDVPETQDDLILRVNKSAGEKLLSQAYQSSELEVKLLSSKDQESLKQYFILDRGKFQKAFPLPKGSLGRIMSVALGTIKDLSSIGLIIHKKKNGKVEYIEFHGFAGDKKIGESVFDVTEAQDDLVLRVNKSAGEVLLSNAYQSPDLTVSLLSSQDRESLKQYFDTKAGKFQQTFLFPNGNSLGSNKSLNLGNRKGLTSVGMVIHKKKNGKVEYMEFHGFAGDVKIGESAFNVSEKQDELTLRINKSAGDILLNKSYKSPNLKVTLLSIKDREILKEYLDTEARSLKRNFLLPNENPLGEVKNLHFGNIQGLTSFGVVIHKKNSGKVEYMEFHGFAGNDKISESIFDVSEDQDALVLRVDKSAEKVLSKAYQSSGLEVKLLSPEDRESLKQYFDMKAGRFRKSFLLPNGNSIGEAKSLNLGEMIDLMSVGVRILKKENGMVDSIEFQGFNSEDKKIGSSRWLWNEATGTLRPMNQQNEVEKLIEKYGLEQVIVSGLDEPELLLTHILLTTDLPPEVAQQIVKESFKALRGLGNQTADVDLTGYTQTSDTVTVESIPQETDLVTMTIKGKVNNAYSAIKIDGDRNRVVEVNPDGSFFFKLMLEKGKTINLSLVGFNEATQTMTQVKNLEIKQTGEPESLEDILNALLNMSKEIQDRIKKSPEQARYLTQRLERGLLKYFTENEKAGLREIERRMKAKKTNDLLRILYQNIYNKFKSIVEMNITDLRETERLYFYQKYAIYEIVERMKTAKEKKGEPGVYQGVVLAMEQGLGKTVVVLSVIRDHKTGAIIVVPNAVVTAWGENEGKFFKKDKLEVIQGSSAKEKIKQLLNPKRKANDVVNKEFLRDRKKDNRLKLLNKKGDRIIVVDEMQYLTSVQSQQTQGARELQGEFTILVSATPFSNLGGVANVLGFLDRMNPAFQSQKAFRKQFENKDSNNLRTMHFMLNPFVIRIKKGDVFKTYDRNELLDKQKDRLPEKVYVPFETLGEYELDLDQSEAILTLISDWETFQEEIIKEGRQSAEDEQIRKKSTGGDTLSKMHSIKQAQDSRSYVGLKGESSKDKKMDEIVKKEVVDGKGKVFIVTQYCAQVEKYLKRYEHLGALSYYGGTEQELPTKGGYLVDQNGERRLFRMKNEHEFAIGVDGRPIEEAQGEPMTPLDYNRLVFQNDPNARVLIATFESGSVGVTFTDADAVIFDHFGRDYAIEYQAEDRAHRIDNDRKKYEVRYYHLVAKYPQAFLEKMKRSKVVEDEDTGERTIVQFDPFKESEVESVYDLWFKQGTYDEVRFRNMLAEKMIFSLVLDGLATEGDLKELTAQLANKNLSWLLGRTKKASVETEDEELQEESVDQTTDENKENGEDENGGSQDSAQLVEESSVDKADLAQLSPERQAEFGQSEAIKTELENKYQIGIVLKVPIEQRYAQSLALQSALLSVPQGVVRSDHLSQVVVGVSPDVPLGNNILRSPWGAYDPKNGAVYIFDTVTVSNDHNALRHTLVHLLGYVALNYIQQDEQDARFITQYEQDYEDVIKEHAEVMFGLPVGAMITQEQSIAIQQQNAQGYFAEMFRGFVFEKDALLKHVDQLSDVNSEVYVAQQSVVDKIQELFDAAQITPEKVQELVPNQETNLPTKADLSYGGIDFNPVNLELIIQKDPAAHPGTMPNVTPDVPLPNIKFDGMIPIILKIEPVNNLPLRLGLNVTSQPIAQSKEQTLSTVQ